MINLHDHVKDLVKKNQEQDDKFTLINKKKKTTNKKKILINGLMGEDNSSMNSHQTSVMQGFGFGKHKDGDDHSKLEGEHSGAANRGHSQEQNLTSLQQKRLEKLKNMQTGF